MQECTFKPILISKNKVKENMKPGGSKYEKLYLNYKERA